MPLPISAIYAAAIALLIAYVSYRVVDFNKGVELSTGYRADIAGDAPFMLLLIILAELNGASGVLVHAMGVMFIACQLARALAFLKVLGRYATEHTFYTVANRCMFILLGLINLALVLGLKI